MGFGDQSGSKLSTQRTYLQDAFDAGADIVVRCTVERVLVENGRAAGVEGICRPETGRTARVVVRAPRVVAAGSLESPALLLRSGIGGPAAGNYLRIHPCTALFGIYGQDQRVVGAAAGRTRGRVRRGRGRLRLPDRVDAVRAGAGGVGASVHGRPGLKEMMERVRYGATFIGLLRERGHGASRSTATDRRSCRGSPTSSTCATRRAIGQARCTRRPVHGDPADGGERPALARWGRPRRVDRALAARPLRAGGFRLFCAHQMGTCRMGKDPHSSGRSVGPAPRHERRLDRDGSAFPTASGTNPMITIMALAHRTAEAIARTRARPPRPRRKQR